MSDPLDYTVGFICALPEESASLQTFLDARHDGPEYVSTNDNNDYTLGRIGKHNVVICALPSNQYGLTAAATVARDLAHSFPNIRIGLMVGIAGGAPNSRNDIRLGDVVVGVASNGNPAVFQYDYGKAIQDHGFQATGFINQPPQILLTAVSGLKAFYEIEGERLEEAVKMALDQRPRMKQKYQRPNASTDRLYRSDFVHPDAHLDCSQTCGNSQSRLRKRKKRDNDGPTIHYGLIASSNSLIKDALVRDGLTKKKGMLCFEMEAAGLLNHFPCLVIRGICDYSDSHKNKKWQGYAAMTAAAYARDLLGRIAPSRLEAEKKIADLDTGKFKYYG
jgi:nucleoside phosphorylase